MEIVVTLINGEYATYKSLSEITSKDKNGVMALDNFKSVEIIEMKSKQDLHQLLKLLKYSSIEHLEIYHSIIENDLDFKILGSLMHNNKTIRTLEFCVSKDNNVMSGFQILGSALRTNIVLRKLDITKSVVNLNDMKQFILSLAQNNSIEELNISGIALDEPAFDAICTLIKFNKRVVYLNLSNSGIGSVYAKKLARALESNSTIESLNLSQNYIDDEGIKQIMEVLETNRVLKYITLDENEITDTGANFILSALRTNNIIRALFSDDPETNISEEILNKISDKLVENTRKQVALEFLASSGYGIKIRPSIIYYNNVILEDLVELMPFKTLEEKLAVARYFVEQAEINFRQACNRERTVIFCGNIADNYRTQADQQQQDESAAMSL